MNPADEQSGIAHLVRGDEQAARELRASLAVFARRTGNARIRRLVSDVLAGRRSVREVLQTKEFTEAAEANFAKVEQGLDQLTDEERAEVFDQSRPSTPSWKLDAMSGYSAGDEDIGLGFDNQDAGPTVPEVPESSSVPPRRVRPRGDDEDEDFSQTSWVTDLRR
jgi:hypothetical protein